MMQSKAFAFLNVFAVVVENGGAVFFTISGVRSLEGASARMISIFSRG
jgi:hypothetical protein